MQDHLYIKKPFSGKGIISARPEQLFFDDKEGLPGTITISTFLGDFIEYEILLDEWSDCTVK